MHTYSVKYSVPGVGIVEEVVRAGSEYNVRLLIRSKYPGQQINIIQVTQLD